MSSPWATGDTLTTLRPVQLDVVLDQKVWPYSSDCYAIISSSPYPRTQLSQTKPTKSKTDCETNTIETGSKIYSADIHCIRSSTSTIIILKSDIYQHCQLLLNKKACWMVIVALITVVALTPKVITSSLL